MGIVSVTRLAAKLAGEPDATMRSTFRATSSQPDRRLKPAKARLAWRSRRQVSLCTLLPVLRVTLAAQFP
jgi:hypothetical protein